MKTIRFTVLIVASAWVLTACGGVGVGVPTPSDTTAPTISRVAVEPSTLIVPGATSVRVEAHVTDDGSGRGCRYREGNLSRWKRGDPHAIGRQRRDLRGAVCTIVGREPAGQRAVRGLGAR